MLFWVSSQGAKVAENVPLTPAIEAALAAVGWVFAAAIAIVESGLDTYPWSLEVGYVPEWRSCTGNDEIPYWLLDPGEEGDPGDPPGDDD
jgi:hypothetical protein